MVLYNIFAFACEIGALDENPLRLVRWTRPRMLSTVDPRSVINPQQARRFLTAVEAHSERGRRLKAFFACMYYAALRPEEVSELRRSNLTHLPEQPGHWGEIRLTGSAPRSGSRRTESAKPREQGPLKHRARGGHSASACQPDLVVLLRGTPF